MNNVHSVWLATIGAMAIGATCLACGSSSSGRRTGDSGGAGGTGGSAGSSGAGDDVVNCGSAADGCLAGQIMSLDTEPFDPNNPHRDGQGTAYVVLLDVCPDMETITYSPLSHIARVQVDLSDSQAEDFQLGFRFDDPDFPDAIHSGDTGVLAGFLDDDESSEDSANPAPNNGDSIFNCIEVTLDEGLSNLVSPLAPCLFYDLSDLPDSLHVFDQGGMADCSVYAEALGVGGAGGA